MNLVKKVVVPRQIRGGTARLPATTGSDRGRNRLPPQHQQTSRTSADAPRRVAAASLSRHGHGQPLNEVASQESSLIIPTELEYEYVEVPRAVSTEHFRGSSRYGSPGMC